MPFKLVVPLPFEEKFKKLGAEIKEAAKKTIVLLSQDPRHPSLRTHKVKGTLGMHEGDVFEAYVSKKYRLTWEYGPDQGMITLRNIDNHDECLKKP
jgi:mRNA interferase RelE/StbE